MLSLMFILRIALFVHLLKILLTFTYADVPRSAAGPFAGAASGNIAVSFGGAVVGINFGLFFVGHNLGYFFCYFGLNLAYLLDISCSGSYKVY